MRVAIYYRVSTDTQDIASQKYAVDRWLEDQRPRKTTIYEDYAMSGSNRDRPQLNKMLKAAKDGKIDAIVVYRLDRLSRSASEAIEIFLKLDRLCIDLVCIKQPMLTTKDNPFRRTMITMFAELAEVEKTIMISRIKDGIAAARARGVVFGSPLKLTPEKIDFIRKLREDKYSLREIAKLTDISIGSVHTAIKKQNSQLS